MEARRFEPGYPAWFYHREGPAKIVDTPDEAAALGPDWSDTPATWAQPDGDPTAPSPEAEADGGKKRKK